MKKSILALAVAAVATSSVASAAQVYNKDGTTMDVYGRVQTVYYSQDAAGGDNSYGDSSLQASGRLGFYGTTELGYGITGFGRLEWDVADGKPNKGPGNNTAADDSFDARFLQVGADFGQFGILTLGRQESDVKYATLLTDIFDDWGCNGFAGGEQRDGIIQYQWSGYGFDIIVNGSGAQDNQQVEGLGYVDLQDTYAIALGYTSPNVLFGPIAVRAAYAHFDSQNGDVDTNDIIANGFDNLDNFVVSAAWGTLAQGPYVAALYSNASYDFDKLESGDEWDYTIQGAEFVVGYGFANGVAIRTGIEWANIEFDNKKTLANGDDDAQSLVIPVYVNYQINPNFNVWAEARLDAGTDDGDNELRWGDIDNGFFTNNAENVYSVGARYTF